jgi:hypothetical protein
MLFISSKTDIRRGEGQVIVDQSEGTTSRTGRNREDRIMGGSHDVTEQSNLISSVAQLFIWTIITTVFN